MHVRSQQMRVRRCMCARSRVMSHSVQRRRALPLARRGECFALSQQSAGAAPRDFVRLSAMHVGSQQSKESRCAAAACAPVCLPGRVLSHIATQRGAAPPPGSAPAAGASARSAGAAGRARGRPARPPRARPGAQGAAHERRPRPPHHEGGKSVLAQGARWRSPGLRGRRAHLVGLAQLQGQHAVVCARTQTASHNSSHVLGEIHAALDGVRLRAHPLSRRSRWA